MERDSKTKKADLRTVFQQWSEGLRLCPRVHVLLGYTPTDGPVSHWMSLAGRAGIHVFLNALRLIYSSWYVHRTKHAVGKDKRQLNGVEITIAFPPCSLTEPEFGLAACFGSYWCLFWPRTGHL